MLNSGTGWRTPVRRWPPGSAGTAPHISTRRSTAGARKHAGPPLVPQTSGKEETMSVEIANYHILVYGGPEGYQTNRAQISLFDSAGNTAAYLRFNDRGMDFENDS